MRNDSDVAAITFRRRLRYAAIGVLCLALTVAPLVVTNSYYRYAGVLMVMFMAMSSSWNIMGGLTGYMSLGHSAFFGLGAYSTGMIAGESRASLLVALALTPVIALGLGVSIGAVAVRVRGSSFVIVTIAFVYIGTLLAQGLRTWTGGSTGLDVPGLFDVEGRAANHAAYLAVFAGLLFVVLTTWNFVDGSKFGMGLKAIREDEDRAESLGVPTMVFKATAFGLSAMFVALAGGLYASWIGFIDPIFVFSVQISAQVVLMALFGGVRSLWGPVVGAAAMVPMSEFFLVRMPEYHLIAVGLVLGGVVLLMPHGVVPALERVLERRKAPAASIREQGGLVFSDQVGEAVDVSA